MPGQRTASITTRIETFPVFGLFFTSMRSENSIHYNKDWDCIPHSIILSYLSSENSIHYNKDWDLFVEDVCSQDIDVREQHPLQQGLRQFLRRTGVPSTKRQRTASITTRIETCRTSYHRLQRLVVWEQHPLQQGLRRVAEISEGVGEVQSENSIHYNKDWD